MKNVLRAFDEKRIDLMNVSGRDLPSTRKAVVSDRHYYSMQMLLVSFKTKRQYPRLARYINQTIDREGFSAFLNKINPVFVPAYGVVPPFSRGHYDGRGDLKKVREKKPDLGKEIELLVVEGASGDRLNYILEYFERVGINIKAVFVPLNEFLKRVSRDEYEIGMLSFGVSSFSETMLWYFYGPSPILPVAHGDIEQRYLDLHKIDSVSFKQNHELIKKFEREMFSQSHLVPLLFSKAQYLIQKCINVENMIYVSAVEKIHEIGRLKKCED